MKLKIRYENEIQTIELDAKATEEMWVSLSLEGEGLSQKEKENLKLIHAPLHTEYPKDTYYVYFFYVYFCLTVQYFFLRLFG